MAGQGIVRHLLLLLDPFQNISKTKKQQIEISNCPKTTHAKQQI